MQDFFDFMYEFTSNRIVKTIIVILVATVLYIVAKLIMDKVVEKTLGISNKKNKERTRKKSKSFIIVINSFIKYIFVIVVTLIILEVNGVNITSLITGLGIVSVIIGLAVQESLKDMLSGKNIISYNYFQVGDVIKFEDYIGKVVSIDIKTTKIRDIYTDSLVTISNRNIANVEVLSDKMFIRIPAPYGESLDRMDKVFTKIVKETLKLEKVKDCKFLGLREFKNSNIDYMISVICNPEHRPSVLRQVHGIVKNIFDHENIAIPFNQLDVHLDDIRVEDMNKEEVKEVEKKVKEKVNKKLKNK